MKFNYKTVAKYFAIVLILLSILISSMLYLWPIMEFRSIGLMKDKLRGIKTCQENKGTENIEPLKDFNNYPCLGKDPNTPDGVLPYGCVRTVCREDTRWLLNSNTTFCVPLTKIKQKICTYDPSYDLVSRYIHKDGAWEGPLVDTLVRILKAYPELSFLDIGCNIGTYTIAAASLRIQSFCIDANKNNLRLVSKSLSLGHLQDNVTLIWNALSDTRGPVNFNIVKGNIGASRIGSLAKERLTLQEKVSASAILLDDLQWLMKGKQFFMKVDIEGHQFAVLKGASEFFKKFDVRFIQMEIYRFDPFHEIVDLLYSWGYLMFRDPEGRRALHKKDFVISIWPGDVYFVKVSHLHGQ